MRRLMNDNRIREISSSIDIQGLNLLDSRTTVDSLLENDKYSYEKWSDFGLIRETYGNRLLPDLNHFPEKCKILRLTCC